MMRLPSIQYPPELPITSVREEFLRLIREHPVIVLAGETGSGKSTQVPKFCLEAGRAQFGRIACTQPRRVAALSVSHRVAEELQVSLGREVGCKIRFRDQTSPQTLVKFLTDGMLLAELQADRELRAYGTIIVDEAHERSLNIDFLLGYLNTLRLRRPELRIVITSATIDTGKFSAAFGGAPIVQVSGRTFPVEIVYAPLDELQEESGEFTVVDASVAATERVLAESSGGDVLIFLPGEREIRETAERIEGWQRRNLQVLPLFSRLSVGEQQRVFAPTTARKVIIATNVAETSLTIPGVRYVIDSGLARLSRYVPRTRTKRLPIEAVSQSSANQRAGRAGRVAAGVCVRLYSEEDFSRRPAFTQPELQRANLAEVILRLLASRLGEIETFPFIDPPATAAIQSGYALLDELGALEEAQPDQPRRLSALGRELSRLPVDPTVGRMLLRARDEHALREVLVIAAALSIQDPRERPADAEAAADAAHRKFVHPESDFLTLLHIWDAFHDDAERLSLGRLKKFCRAHFLNFNRMREWFDVHTQLAASVAELETEEWRVPHDEADSPEDTPAEPERRTESGAQRAESSEEGVRKSEPRARGGGDDAGLIERTDDWRFGGERFRAVHRALLSGLLANVARRDEGNHFNATTNRKVMLFPGSALFTRSEKKAAPANDAAARAKRGPKDMWIVAAEMVETTRLYARTGARVDPLWVLELGAHVLKRSYGEPDWHPDAGRVLVRERTLLHGLELQNRHIDFGRIDPVQATEIFIRGALVADTLETPTLPFLDHNRRLRAKAATIQTQVRSKYWLTIEEAAYEFYRKHLAAAAVSSVHDLQREWKKHATANPQWLRMNESDLLGALEEFDPAWFPDSVALDNRALPLNYTYKPGAPEDGITLSLPYKQARLLSPALLDWLVPGHLEEKVHALLRTLPKASRVALNPLEATARQIAKKLSADGRPLVAVLADHLARHHGLAVGVEEFRPEELPQHLRVRLEVVDERGAALAAGREFAAVQQALAEHEKSLAQKPDDRVAKAWREARVKFERSSLDDWSFGELPAKLVVCDVAGVPVHAFPALVAEGAARAALKLFVSEAEARAATPAGVAALIEAQLSREFAWLENELRDLRELGPAAIALQPMAQWQEDAFRCLRRWVIEQPVSPLTHDGFVLRVAAARAALKGIVWKMVDVLREILALRTTLLTHPQAYPTLATEVDALVGSGFLARTPWVQLAHVARYLKAMKARADRWRGDPGKDHRRAQSVAPWSKHLGELSRAPVRSREHAARLDEFRWLIEEFRVSVFAQELGTAVPVSEKKLEAKLGEVRVAAAPGSSGSAPLAEAAPRSPALPAQPVASAGGAAPAAPSKSTPVKSTRLNSLGDLGRILGR